MEKEAKEEEEARGSQEKEQPPTREAYKEREIIRETVKIRCRHCGIVFDEKVDCCPYCGESDTLAEMR